MKDNIELVNYAKKALQEKWGYVWGTFGQTLTDSLLRQKINQYPRGVGGYERFIRNNWLGGRTADCVGLIKSYMWFNNGRINYDRNTDVNANMMFNRAREKGPINTIPEIPGLCVWRKGHIGVYIGNGWVIEARGTKYGVVKTRLKDRNFTHWLKCPYISYEPRKEDKPMPQEVSKYAKEAWDWGKKNGLTDGSNPRENMTREQGITILHRYHEKKSKGLIK